MSVILPLEIERLAERRAAEAGFRDAADPALEAALLEGLDGDGEEWSLEPMRAECRASLAAARKSA